VFDLWTDANTDVIQSAGMLIARLLEMEAEECLFGDRFRYGWRGLKGQKPGASRMLPMRVRSTSRRLKRSGEKRALCGRGEESGAERGGKHGSFCAERASEYGWENGLKVFMDDLQLCGAPNCGSTRHLL